MSIAKFDLVSPSTSGPLSPRVIAENQLLRLRRGLYVLPVASRRKIRRRWCVLNSRLRVPWRWIKR